MELGILYELTGPDGTRIVFGNCAAAQADPDYVGWIDPEAGIAGLDAPEVRESALDLIGADGGVHYDFFHGRRPVSANLVLDPRLTDALGVDTIEQKVKRATNAMRADALLKFTPSPGGSIKWRLALRRQQPPRITGRRPKAALLAMVCSDYRQLSDALHASAATASGAGVVCANAGDETATARVELTAGGGGAGGAIEVHNDTTGQVLKMKGTTAVAAGKVLVVDFNPPFPVVTIDGADAYGQVDFLNTAWWGMSPGNNTVRVVTPTGAGTFVVKHRDARI